MLRKLLFSSMITFLLIDTGINLEAQEKLISNKNSIIYTFCIASLKSKLDIKSKQNSNEISAFTCECFFRKYKSGNSLKKSRTYCRDKAAEKYNL